MLEPNYDEKTGIFYGVIAQNSLNLEVVDDILFGSDTIDLSYEEAKKELNKNIEDHLGCLTDIYNLSVDIIGEHSLKYSWEKENLKKIRDILNCFKNHRIKEIKEILLGEFNIQYGCRCDNPDFLYESDGYKIIKCLDYDLMIIKSPYYCFAPKCSPCVPCAGNLDGIKKGREYKKQTYCLDSSFYESDEKPKYQIYRVSDNIQVHGPLEMLNKED